MSDDHLFMARRRWEIARRCSSLNLCHWNKLSEQKRLALVYVESQRAAQKETDE